MVVGFMGDFIPWGPAHFRSQKITEQKTRNPSHVETSQGYSMGFVLNQDFLQRNMGKNDEK